MIDIRRSDLLIEIQTGSFAALGRKLDRLLVAHRILLVHPIATTTFLHKRPEGESQTPPPTSRGRRSPRRGDLYNLLDELVSIPSLLDHPNMAIEVVLTTVDKIQRPDPKARRGRGGWRTVDRRLRDVESRHRFDSADDLVALMPGDLPEVFTTADMAAAGGFRRDVAQKLAYCLRAMDRIVLVDHTAAGHHYRWA